MNVQPEIKPGERQTSTVYVVHLEARGEDLKAIQDQAIQQAQYRIQFKEQMQEIQSKYRKMLTYNDSPDEQRYDAMEYSPEFQDDETPDVTVVPRNLQQFKEKFKKPEPIEEPEQEEPEDAEWEQPAPTGVSATPMESVTLVRLRGTLLTHSIQ